MKFIDLTGHRFGRFVVDSRDGNNSFGHPQWRCTCECGSVVTVSGCNLRTGNSQSCGCLRKETLSRLYRLRPYESLYRLFKRAAEHTVHLSYEDFVRFTDQGECHYCGASVDWPEYQTNESSSAYNLDRKDNDRGYTVENCVVCCGRCNAGKGYRFTYHEWKEIGNLIRSWKTDK